jgi:hypothetical protein
MKRNALQFTLFFLLAGCTPVHSLPIGENYETRCVLGSSLDACLPKAERGDKEAQSIVGSLYENGRDTPQNYSEAMKWYRKAADQGDDEAALRVGMFYELGDGVEKNEAEAQKWYLKATEHAKGLKDFQTQSLSLPPVIAGLGGGLPFYEFSFLMGEQKLAIYNKAFHDRLQKKYPPGTPEKSVIADLNNQGFRIDEYRNGLTGFTGKDRTVYFYSRSVGNLVIFWAIAWRTDNQGNIFGIDGHVTAGIS